MRKSTKHCSILDYFFAPENLLKSFFKANLAHIGPQASKMKPQGSQNDAQSLENKPPRLQKTWKKQFFHEQGRGERSRRDTAGKMIAQMLRVFLA